LYQLVITALSFTLLTLPTVAQTTWDRDIEVRVLANRIRRGTTLSRHLLAQLEALGLHRLETTLSEAVAYGEVRIAACIAHNRAGRGGNRRPPR
jgi:hypothetical protein